MEPANVNRLRSVSLWRKFMRTLLSLYSVACCLLIQSSLLVAADDRNSKVVSIDTAGGKIVVTDQSDQKKTQQIPSSARIQRNGKTATLNDLKKGDTINFTTDNDGKVTEIVASNAESDANTTNNSTDASFKDKSDSEMPRFLRNLTLTQEQKDKIKNVCNECSEQRETAWREFGEKYRETIGLEAAMLAAIEENLTDVQRKHIRDQRERMANRREQREARQAARDERKNRDDKGSDRNNAKDNSDRKDSDRKDSSDKKDSDKNIVVEEITVVGVTLSPEQESVAEDVRGNYFDHLHKLNGELQSLHSRLVAMETDRLLKIEEILTKEQKESLRKEHHKIAQAAKSAVHHAKTAR